MTDLDSLRRLAIYSTGLAIVLTVPSSLAFFAAFGGDVEAAIFARRPHGYERDDDARSSLPRSVAGKRGGDRADLARVGNWRALFGAVTPDFLDRRCAPSAHS
jgi:hypothetical protein